MYYAYEIYNPYFGYYEQIVGNNGVTVVLFEDQGNGFENNWTQPNSRKSNTIY